MTSSGKQVPELEEQLTLKDTDQIVVHNGTILKRSKLTTLLDKIKSAINLTSLQDSISTTAATVERVATYATQGVIIDDDGLFYALVEEG